MEFKCNICNRKFNSEESLEQHNKSKHSIEERKDNKKVKKYVLIAVLLIAIGLISYTFYFKSQKPGEYDNFARCLTEKGAVIYGNDFCQYTNKQLNDFGKSDKYLKYVKCADNKELCDSKNVKITPTWEINKEMYEGIQSYDRLSQLSGCEI